MSAQPYVPIPPPVPYFGAKGNLAVRLARLLPPHRHYVEPFAGSLTVLLAKPPSELETVNDLDQHVVTFWRVVRDRPDELQHAIEYTPHSRAEFILADDQDADDELETARRVWTRLTQGRAANLRSTGWRYDIHPYSVNKRDLIRFRDRLPAAARRLLAVQIECRPALDIIARYGQEPSVLLYCDPPYLGETRAGVGYRHEMTDPEQHRELAAALHNVPATVVLSGYRSPLYDELYADWYADEFPAHTTQGGDGKATCEVVWSNRPLGGRHQPTLWE